MLYLRRESIFYLSLFIKEDISKRHKTPKSSVKFMWTPSNTLTYWTSYTNIDSPSHSKYQLRLSNILFEEGRGV